MASRAVQALMGLDGILLRKAPVILGTLDGLLPTVLGQVGFQASLQAEAPAALGAREGPPPCGWPAE